MQFQDDLAAGVVLVRPALMSPNYSPGAAGWVVNADGSAELNNVVIRGGTTVSGTSLYYNGTPGPGKLILSISATAGTDAYGNSYPAGVQWKDTAGTLGIAGTDLSLSATDGSKVEVTAAGLFGNGIYLTPPASTDSTWVPGAAVADFNSNAPDSPYMSLYSPYDSVTGRSANIVLTGSDKLNRPTEIDLNADQITLSSPVTSYAGNTMTTYTPTVTGDGGAVYTTRTGRWRRFGPWAWVEIDLVVGATAGTGTTPLSVTAPAVLDKSVRQFLPGSGDSLTGNSGSLTGLSLTGANSNVIDRLRNSTGANLTGSSLQANGVVTLRGWLRLA